MIPLRHVVLETPLTTHLTTVVGRTVPVSILMSRVAPPVAPPLTQPFVRSRVLPLLPPCSRTLLRYTVCTHFTPPPPPPKCVVASSAYNRVTVSKPSSCRKFTDASLTTYVYCITPPPPCVSCPALRAAACCVQPCMRFVQPYTSSAHDEVLGLSRSFAHSFRSLVRSLAPLPRSLRFLIRSLVPSLRSQCAVIFSTKK